MRDDNQFDIEHPESQEPMRFRHRLQRCRYEMKYLISERTAEMISDYLRTYLEPDEFCANSNVEGYQIHSIYLDNPALALCRATVEGLKSRYKLRVRFYDEVAEHPVFFEIKRRDSDAIFKDRAMVQRDMAVDLIAGAIPHHSVLFNDGDDFPALWRFFELQQSIDGVGRFIVSYRRFAWVQSKDDEVRVTFDRELTGQRYENSFELAPAKYRYTPAIPGVILELKFTDRMPMWMLEMIRIFNLERSSLPKYVECVETIMNRRFRAPSFSSARAGGVR